MDSRYLLFLTRALRGFVYGIFSVITVIYLINSGLQPIWAGVAVTSSILVSSALTFIITTKFGTGYSRSFLLLFSALLIIGISGIFTAPFPMVKALFAIIGSLGVNPSDNTLFSSYEQPIISKIKEDQNQRNRLFALYSFAGYLASSVGAIALGSVGVSVSIRLSILLAAVILVSYFFIPTIKGKKSIKKSPVSKRSKIITRDVSALFSVDAIGGGFVIQSLMSYWFKLRYSFNYSQLGYVFAVVDVIMALSVLFTPFIARKIGLVRTMVFTHIPSNIFLILIPLVPSLFFSLLFLFLRQTISQMDVPTRQSYLNSVVAGDDRSYVVGVSNAVRSASNGATPYLSTYLISIAAGSVSFVAGGAIKIAYDLLFYQRFKSEKEHYVQDKR